MRALRVAIGVVLAAGVVACVSGGANSPPDPTLAPAGGDVVDLTDADRPSVCENPDGEFSAETDSLLATFETRSIRIGVADDSFDLCVLAATTVDQRARGLMEVTEFDGFDGMVFIYDADSTGAYYMFNTYTALTIYWWDGAGSLVSSTEMESCLDLPAEQCPRYPPDGAYRYAVEVPLGALDGRISEGSQLTVA